MHRQLATVVAIGIFSHLVMLALIDPLIGGDSLYYIPAGRMIAEHGALDPRYYRPPGYPLFLALLFQISHHPAFVMAVQSCLTVGVAVLALLRLPKPIGFNAALLIASSPFLIVFDYAVVSESLLVALLLAAFLVRQPIVSGMLLGLAILTRDTLLLLPLLVIGFGLIDRSKLKHSLIVALVACLIVLPWPARNSLLPDGQFTLSEGRFGLNLWIGTWERNGDWMRRGVKKADFPDYAFQNDRAEIYEALQTGNDEVFKRAAFKRIANDPLFVVSSWVARYPGLWLGSRVDWVRLRIDWDSLLWGILNAGLKLLNALTLLAGLAGMVLAIRRRSELAYLSIPVIYIALVHTPFHNVEPRYSLPALAFLCVFAAYLLSNFHRHPAIRSADGDAVDGFGGQTGFEKLASRDHENRREQLIAGAGQT